MLYEGRRSERNESSRRQGHKIEGELYRNGFKLIQSRRGCVKSDSPEGNGN